MALIDVSHHIYRLLDDGNYVIVIFIDFTKVFNTADYVLFHKLHRYGIGGHANNLMELLDTLRLLLMKN